MLFDEIQPPVTAVGTVKVKFVGYLAPFQTYVKAFEIVIVVGLNPSVKQE